MHHPSNMYPPLGIIAFKHSKVYKVMTNFKLNCLYYKEIPENMYLMVSWFGFFFLMAYQPL